MSNPITFTAEQARKLNIKIVIWATFLGGFMSSLVKYGSEVNTPPRMPGEPSPPGLNIDAWFGWLGINQHSLDYTYQGTTVLGAVSLYHWLFSFIFAGVYVLWSMGSPKIRMWYGAIYGLIITVFAHGIMIPAFGFRFPAYDPAGSRGWLWNLNGYELFAEISGHIYWAISIEFCLIVVLAVLGRPIKGDWVARPSK